jgi:hypothetical protein
VQDRVDVEPFSARQLSFVANFIATLVMMLAVVGCLFGCSKQDPYAGYGDRDKAQAPNAPKPAIAKATIADALKIDTAREYYSFVEGKEDQVQLGGRMLIELNGRSPVINKDFELKIDNLSDFFGAKFDASSGVFTWTPPIGFTKGEYTQNAELEVSIVTTAAPFVGTAKSIRIFIQRATQQPMIQTVDDLMKNPTREGEATKFNVVVRDPDADMDISKQPRVLVVSATQDLFNAANLVHLEQSTKSDPNPSPDPKDKTLWVFRYVLDTRNHELTKGQDTFSFGLIAISRFGNSSAPVTVNANIITSVPVPILSWLDSVHFSAGQTTTFQFSAFDPSGNGDVKITCDNCSILPGKPAFICEVQSRDGFILCSITWTVPANQPPGSIEVRMTLTNKTRVEGDTAQTQETVSKLVQIVPSLDRAAINISGSGK